MGNKLSSSLNGLNALVCGSTSGIGEAVAIEFSKLGANITLFARNEKKLKSTLSQLNNTKDQNHHHLIGDFDDSENIRTTITNHIQMGNR